MRRFPVVNLGQFEGLPLDPETLSRLCDAVNTYNAAARTPDRYRTPEIDRMGRDALADVKSILGPMNLTNRRAAEAQLWKNCGGQGVRPILDQIPFAEPPPAEQVTTAQTPFYSPGPAQPPPPYKPVASVDPNDTGPRTLPPHFTEGPAPIYPPAIETGTAEFPGLTPTGSGAGPAGELGCWFVPGQGHIWGPRPPGAERTDLKESDCANLERLRQEVSSISYQTTQPVEFTQEAPPGTQAALSPNRFDLTPQENRPDVASTMCPIGSFVDPVTRECRGSVKTGYGNLTNLTNIASMAPAATAFTMGRRIQVKNLGQSSGLEQLAEELKKFEKYLKEYCEGPTFDQDCEAVHRRYEALLNAYNELQQRQQTQTPQFTQESTAPMQTLPQSYQSYQMVHMTPIPLSPPIGASGMMDAGGIETFTTPSTTGEAPMESSWNRAADCVPPMEPAPGGGCRPGRVATRGGFGNLMNIASMAPAMTTAAASFMGRRLPVKNLF